MRSVEWRFIEKLGNLAVRRNGYAAGVEIDSAAIREKEGNRGGRIAHIGQSQTSVYESGNVGVNPAPVCWNRTGNSRFRNQHSVCPISENRKT